MKTIKINDSFPGASKGKTKVLDDETANDLIANKWGTEVKEKAKTPAELKAEKEAAEAEAKAKADAEAKEAADKKAKADAEAAGRETKIDENAENRQTK